MPLGEVGGACAYASPVTRVLVIGLARSGRAAVAALRANGENVVAYDVDSRLDTAGIDAEIRLGGWDDVFLDAVGMVVKSPGVPSDAPSGAPAGAGAVKSRNDLGRGSNVAVLSLRETRGADEGGRRRKPRRSCRRPRRPRRLQC